MEDPEGEKQAADHLSLSYLTCRQTLESYDEDSYKTVDYLLSLPTCTRRIGSTGMCLGGHLALRAAVCELSYPRHI
jgi:dienelactone hydrolase